MKNKLITLALILFLLVGGTALAQVNPNEGRILGRVLDDQGNPLPGVSVEATSPKLVGKAATVTDGSGYFRLLALPSGTYEITFSLQGFKTIVRKDIVLKLGDTITVNVNMEPAAIEEQITVVGQSPLIDVKSTVKGQTLNKETFMALPRGRDFSSLITVVPGVSYEPITGGYSFDGATGTENMWYVDGADVTGVHRGLQNQNVALELVDEVKVTAAGYNAEFGGSMGGVVNVITRSGGNTFHGDVIVYYNNNETWMSGKTRDYLRTHPYNSRQYLYWNNDRDYFGGGKYRDNYYRLEPVFSLGGFIIKDKLWFFFSLDPVYAYQTGDRNFSASVYDHTNTSVTWYNFNRKTYYYNGSIKLTAAPISGLRLSASYVNNTSKYKGAFPGLDANSLQSDEYSLEGYTYPNFTASFTADYSPSNNLLLSLRAGWHQDKTTGQTLKPQETNVYFYRATLPSGYSSLISWLTTVYTGLGYTSQQIAALAHNTGWMNHLSTGWLDTKKNLYDKVSANFDFTYYLNLLGEHAIKGGVQFIYLHENVDNLAKYPIVYLYWRQSTSSLGFPIGRTSSATPEHYGEYGYYIVRHNSTSIYGSLWNIHSNNWALYLQDSWTISNKLTFNFGVRTESEYIPGFSQNYFPGYLAQKPIKFDFQDKIAPRLGVVYDVFGDSSLKLFANFGIYYDVMKLYMAEGAFGGFKWVNEYYTLNDPDWSKISPSGGRTKEDLQGAGTGNLWQGYIDYRVPSFGLIDPNLKPVSQSELSFGAEKKLTENLSLNVRFTHKHLIRTIEDVGVFVTMPGGGSGEVYYITNPGFGWSLHESQGGKFADYVEDEEGNIYEYWPMAKAKRNYYGMNLSLEKRFSNNWQGGISYTLSRIVGNYGGLSSPDENGRNSPNVERYWDYWFMPYDMNGTPLDGPLPQDRTHYIKAYGSYTFPFGLTVGITGYVRSGLPLSSRLYLNSAFMYPFNYGDLGRLPWTAWADLFVEYNLKIAGKYNLGINVQVNNVTNTRTIQGKFTTMNYDGYMYLDDWDILNGWLKDNLMDLMLNYTGYTSGYSYMNTLYWYYQQSASDPKEPVFGKWTSRFDPLSVRVGFKFSF